MKVLIMVPENISNPFIYRLYLSLKNNCHVEWKLPNLIDLNYDIYSDFDIINIHWPESLFSWHKPSENDLKYLRSFLKIQKRKSKIVYNVHNVIPHFRHTSLFKELYNIILESADLLIHLSNNSFEKFKHLTNKQHCVIPHGNFNHLPNFISREDARNYFKLNQKEIVILSFGHLRDNKEKLNGLRVYFNDFVNEGLGKGEILCYRKGDLFYFNKTLTHLTEKQRFLHYHFVTDKNKITFNYPNWDEIPDEFYITEYGFIKEKDIKYLIFIKIKSLIMSYLTFIIFKLPIKILNKISYIINYS
jgi:hypothetical protein